MEAFHAFYGMYTFSGRIKEKHNFQRQLNEIKLNVSFYSEEKNSINLCKHGKQETVSFQYTLSCVSRSGSNTL